MENNDVKQLIQAVQTLGEAIQKLSNASQKNSRSVESLSVAVDTHTVNLLATQLSVQALFIEAAKDPERVAVLHPILETLADQAGSRLLFTRVSDELLAELPEALNKLLPAQLQLGQQQK